MATRAYIRVSTTGQAQEGISLEAQQAKVQAWASLNEEHEPVVYYIDAGISGCRADNRPELQRLLSEIREGDVLVVYSLSRLARSTKDTIEISELLNKRGAHLVSLSEKIDTTSASGKMVFRLLAVLAEFERDLVSERTKLALAHLRAEGRNNGQPPYGFRLGDDGTTLVEDEKEKSIIRFVVEYSKNTRPSGKPVSYRAIAAAAAAAGFYSREGKVLSAQSVSNILAANRGI